jgi:hypothetical protein
VTTPIIIGSALMALNGQDDSEMGTTAVRKLVETLDTTFQIRCVRLISRSADANRSVFDLRPWHRGNWSYRAWHHQKSKKWNWACVTPSRPLVPVLMFRKLPDKVGW